MAEGFHYGLANWLPFQDQAACARARAIKKQDITKHRNPEFKIEIVRDADFAFLLVSDIFRRIKQASEQGRKLVLILPQPEPLYRWVALLLNQHKVDCRQLYTFNMDEYADEHGHLAPATWPNAFMYNMKRNFYAQLDPKLRPPENQIQGPTNRNCKDYGQMIADQGGADVCYGGIGWSGHLAFIEPGSKAFAAASWEDWCRLDARFVELTPITMLQNCLGPETGQSGDWSAAPPHAFTIGPKEILAAKLRSSWNGFRVGNSMVSWQRFIVRLAAHGPVNPMIPASLLQTVPSELHLTETVADTITQASVEDFSWYA